MSIPRPGVRGGFFSLFSPNFFGLRSQIISTDEKSCKNPPLGQVFVRVHGRRMQNFTKKNGVNFSRGGFPSFNLNQPVLVWYMIFFRE